MDLISRRKEASIAFVAVVLFVYFSVSTPRLPRHGQPAGDRPVHRRHRDHRRRRGDAADLRRDRPLARPHLHDDAVPHVVRDRVGVARSRWRSCSGCSAPRRSARSTGCSPSRPGALVHHDARHAVLPQRLHADHLRRLPEAVARRVASPTCSAAPASPGSSGRCSSRSSPIVILSSTRWGVHTVATGGNPIGAPRGGRADQADQGRQLHARRRLRRLRRHQRGDPRRLDRPAVGRLRPDVPRASPRRSSAARPWPVAPARSSAPSSGRSSSACCATA